MQTDRRRALSASLLKAAAGVGVLLLASAGWLSYLGLRAAEPAVPRPTPSQSAPATPTSLSAGVPTITGTVQVGRKLSAAPGQWTSGVSFAYQWFRSGKKIAGATHAGYLVRPKDVGTRISLRVTGSASGFDPVTRVSTQTVRVARGELTDTPRPKITGTPKVGYRLTAKAGRWGPGKVTLRYQWFRSGRPIPGATRSSYVLAGADAGAMILVRVTGRAQGYAREARDSASTGRVAYGTLVPGGASVSGKALVGQRFTARAVGWSPAPTGVSYAWFREGSTKAIARASTYTTRTADRGRRLRVEVTVSRPGYVTARRVSRWTAPVLGVFTGSAPTISGTPRVGTVVWPDFQQSTWSPSPTSTKVTWYRTGSGVISTSVNYKPVSADAGRQLRVCVRLQKADYADRTLCSSWSRTVVK